MTFSLNRRLAIKYLLDSSVWLALAIQQHSAHARAKAFFNEKVEPNTILFCQATQQSFLRLLTTNSVLKHYDVPPLTNQQAWELYEGFESNPKVMIVGESVAFNRLWRELSALKSASPKVWMDSYLAAFAIAHDYTLVTLDKDFTQYRNLKVRFL